MLNVGPWLQRQRSMLLSSILLIWQSHLSLTWIISQPSWLHSLSVSLWPRLWAAETWWGRESWVSVEKMRHSVSQVQDRGCTRQSSGPWASKWEADYPEPLAPAVRQQETGRFGGSRWGGRTSCLSCLPRLQHFTPGLWWTPTLHHWLTEACVHTLTLLLSLSLTHSYTLTTHLPCWSLQQ